MNNNTLIELTPTNTKLKRCEHYFQQLKTKKKFILPQSTFYIEQKEKPKEKLRENEEKYCLTNPPVKPIATTINFVQNDHSDKSIKRKKKTF